MKKVIPTLVSIILIIIICICYAQSNGLRLIKDTDGSLSVGIPKTINELSNSFLSNGIITVSEGGKEHAYTYSQADVTTMITGVKYGKIICDMSDLTATYSIPFTSKVFTDITDTRTDYNVGNLAFDDEYNLILENATDSNRVDINEVFRVINDEVKAGKDISINLEDYYVESDTDVERLNMKESIEKYNDFSVSYSNGFELNSKVLAKRKLITFNDDGTYSINASVNICRDIAGKNLTGYNNIGLSRDFTTHDGKQIKVKSETYGNYIDYQAEGEYMLDAILNFKSEENRIPIWKQEEVYPMNKTYIELDKEEQHFYYYVDGRLVLDSDCVTGLPTAKRDTPEGIYFIINKARNANLVGESWDVEVEYWLGVTYSGVGFHDASWRNRFGGNIWKNNGSHGCINTPSAAMKELYEMVEVGTAVIIY